MFMRSPDDDGSERAAEYVGKVLGRFGFGDRWAFHALHEDGRVYGLSQSRLRRLYRSAELVLNLHGGTVPLPEHVSGGPLVYLETDPVELEVELHDDRPHAWEFVKPHSSFFTWGLNYGADDCLVPVPPSLKFMPMIPAITAPGSDAQPAAGAARRMVGPQETARRAVHHDRQLGAALA